MSRFFKFQNLGRATILVALFFGSVSLAAGETYHDIIEKAYNLSLQKDRAQAVSILLGALKRESKKSAAQKDLAQAVDQVAKVFYSDKAQQLYELALSLKTTDPATAQAKLQEAARLEPENVSIEIALERQSLSVGDCDGALTRLNKQKELFPAIEELRLLSAQASLCQNKLEEYVASRNGQDVKRSPLATFWAIAEVEYLFKTQAFAKAQDAIQSLQKQEPNFPEAVYWKWRTENELKQRSEKSAQKYLSLCKTLNSRQFREYLPEPNLCRRTVEIENFLKKTNNSEI
jgi:predicted Zn-dependent protease